MMKKRSNKNFNRYHIDVYFPENFTELKEEFINTFVGDIDLTFHAAEQMFEDKRGQIPLPTNEELLDEQNQIVEFYERLDHLGRIQKAVFRVTNLNETYDYTYVVARGGVIITTWANSKTDYHRLSESFDQYYCPPHLKPIIENKIKDRANNFIKIDNL